KLADDFFYRKTKVGSCGNKHLPGQCVTGRCQNQQCDDNNVLYGPRRHGYRFQGSERLAFFRNSVSVRLLRNAIKSFFSASVNLKPRRLGVLFGLWCPTLGYAPELMVRPPAG